MKILAAVYAFAVAFAILGLPAQADPVAGVAGMSNLKGQQLQGGHVLLTWDWQQDGCHHKVGARCAALTDEWVYFEIRATPQFPGVGGPVLRDMLAQGTASPAGHWSMDIPPPTGLTLPHKQCFEGLVHFTNGPYALFGNGQGWSYAISSAPSEVCFGPPAIIVQPAAPGINVIATPSPTPVHTTVPKLPG
jgi:hypothetical protein